MSKVSGVHFLTLKNVRSTRVCIVQETLTSLRICCVTTVWVHRPADS